MKRPNINIIPSKNKINHTVYPYLIIILFAFIFSACEKEKILFVADSLGTCEATCLQIRENENDEWSNFSETIAGFEYEEGYEYQIKVKIEKSDANTSGFKYTLLDIISKVKKEQMASFEISSYEWKVSAIEGYENKTDKTPTFVIKEGKISGNSGCNSFGGYCQTDEKGMFKTGMLQMTKMYCEAYMDLEKAFTTALNKANTYKWDGKTLKIAAGDGNTLLTAIPQTKPITLENNWYVNTLKGFNNTSGIKPNFSIKNGQISGSNTCNSFGGSVETDASGLFKVGMLRMTKKYCEESVALEKAFHEALGKVSSYKITDNSLLLLDESNYVLISATKEKLITTNDNTSNLPYILEYNTYSQELAIRNKVIEAKNTLYYHDLRPVKTEEQKVMLSKSELLFFKNEIEKIDLKEIEKIIPPSTKYENDGAPGAILIITFEGNTYRTPTFDHGNPPIEIKNIVQKIMALRSK